MFTDLFHFTHVLAAEFCYAKHLQLNLGYLLLAVITSHQMAC